MQSNYLMFKYNALKYHFYVTILLKTQYMRKLDAPGGKIQKSPRLLTDHIIRRGFVHDVEGF